MKVFGVDFREAACRIEAVLGSSTVEQPKEPDTEAQRAQMNDLWSRSKPMRAGDRADLYLRSRGIALDGFPGALRVADTFRCRGMVARVTAHDGKPVNLHRTFLTEDGRKADVECPRKLMKGPFPPGSTVRLHPATETLGIAEGIETALAARLLFGIPVWAALTAGSLQEFRPPQGVTSLMIFGDHDENFVGQAAALHLAKAVHRNSVSAKVLIPDAVGRDWNDELTASARAA